MVFGRSVLDQCGVSGDVNDGDRQLGAICVRKPYCFAWPKGHGLLPSFLNGNIVRVQIGSVGCVAYRVQPSPQAREMSGGLGKYDRASVWKWAEFQ